MQQVNEQPLLECVPNFSEGRNPELIEAIAASIRRVEGVNLLHVDPGFDANRTVMTFVGAPHAVVEAAFQSIKTAAHVIDMRQVSEVGDHRVRCLRGACNQVVDARLDQRHRVGQPPVALTVE